MQRMTDLEIIVLDRVWLKTPNPDDAEALFRAIDANREHLLRWLTWPDLVQTVDDSRTYLSTKQDLAARGSAAPFVLFCGNEIIGCVGIEKTDINDSGEIGYWIAKGFEGRGIVTQAVKRLIWYGFTRMHLNRLVIRCRPANERSSAIPEKLRFRLEGTMRQDYKRDNAYSDTEIYGLLRDEWKDD